MRFLTFKSLWLHLNVNYHYFNYYYPFKSNFLANHKIWSEVLHTDKIGQQLLFQLHFLSLYESYTFPVRIVIFMID